MIPALACGFLMILPGLYPFGVQAGRGSLDLTRLYPPVLVRGRSGTPGGVLRLVEKGTDAGSGWRILRGGGDGLVDHLPNSRRVGELTA